MSGKTSDVTLFYCEDPRNDPGGGFKSRYRTLNKSYRPDMPQTANGYHCVTTPDMQGTFKIQQKYLNRTTHAEYWMHVGMNVGPDQWVGAKVKIKDWFRVQNYQL